MKLKLVKYVAIDYFYSTILKSINEYIKSDNTDLILDASGTSYIQPGILCNLLSTCQWAKDQGKNPIHIHLGYNPKLKDYLVRTQFLSLGINTEMENQLFTTDQDTYVDCQSEIGRNTDKIVFTNCYISRGHDVPNLQSSELEEEQDRKQALAQAKAYQSLYKYIVGVPKIRKMFPYIDDDHVVDMFKGLLENAWEHGDRIKWKQACYYTFQLYEKSGFCFSISDWGMGFYESLLKKATSNAANNTLLKILSIQEFKSLKSYSKDLAGIVEALCFRMESQRYGLCDILNWYFQVRSKDGYRAIRIHSGRVVTVVDIDFLSRYFLLDGTGIIINFNRDSLRSLLLNGETRKNEIARKNIKLLAYEFPGVHIDASISQVDMEIY